MRPLTRRIDIGRGAGASFIALTVAPGVTLMAFRLGWRPSAGLDQSD
jgi:hypothetical protein